MSTNVHEVPGNMSQNTIRKSHSTGERNDLYTKALGFPKEATCMLLGSSQFR